LPRPRPSTVPGSLAERPDTDFLLGRSVEIVVRHQAASGAYIASPSLPTYRFSWFRDGAFVADAMSRAGRLESTGAFFRWCADVISARAGKVDELIRRHRAGEAIDRDEHLHCRYTLAGREGRMRWPNFQLDGYGTWLWALDAHRTRHGASVERFHEAAGVVVRYLAEFWKEPCYDWWEERFARHTATLASLYAGLDAVSEWEELADDVREEAAGAAGAVRAEIEAEAAVDDRLVSRLGESGLDASLIVCATPFRLFPPGDPVIVETVRELEREIAHGGVHRYPGDTYYGGGEWPILAGFLGWYYAEVGRTEDARAQLDWIAAQATADGELPEQVEHHVLDPDALVRWTRRWGRSAVPLLWSHAMFMTLAFELGAACGRGGSAPVTRA
jgi:isomaltose glucohydrolase